MILTIIPFFLIANVQENATWQNGPEYKFNSMMYIKIVDTNDTKTYGLNSTNELKCLPKLENSLKCQFKHVKLLVYEINKESGDIKYNDMIHKNQELYEPFPFEIEFGKTGVVQQIFLNESASKTIVASVAKYMANLLNVGRDLSNIEFRNDGLPTEIINEMDNYLLRECSANIFTGFYEESEKTNDRSWNLDLAPPLEKLSEREFYMLKFWNSSDCKSFRTIFWPSMLIIDDIADSDLMDMMKISGRISVQRNNFESEMGQFFQSSDDKNITVTEISLLSLNEIYSAEEEWPEIEKPVAILFGDN